MTTHSLRFRLSLWYASLLGVCLLLSGASLYIGLERYLVLSLRKELGDQARAIGENLLRQVDKQGEHWVIDEVEDYAPEIYGRFIRIVRPDGSVMYQSGPPRDRSFDPAMIPVPPPGPRAADAEIVKANTPLVLELFALEPAGGGTYLVETGAPYAGIQRVLHGLLVIFLIGMPAVVAAAIAGGYFIVRKGLGPVNAITRQAERISSRTFSERLPVPQTGDEIQSLSISLNRMIARLEEAFEHINRFSADVSHELRTPLAIMRGELEAAAQLRHLPPELLELVGSTLEEIDRLSRIIDHLLIISRLDAGEVLPKSPVNLGDLVASTVEQLHLLADERSIAIEQDVTPAVLVSGDPLRLQQMVVNLLDNAIKYTPEGGRVKVNVARNGSVAILAVADTGIGIPAESMPHVFDRFYRADKARTRDTGGAGLGLSIVKAICSAHGGKVSVSSSEGIGSTFTLELPFRSESEMLAGPSSPNAVDAISGD